MGASGPMSRREALRLAGVALVGVCTHGVRPAYALKPGKPSKDKLLNAIREDRSPEEIEAEKERIAEEKRLRLERQRELQASAERRKKGLEEDATSSTEIESNLRGQYYFPTARKRYLPRVKLAFESIDDAEIAAGESKWGTVSEICTGVLADAVLPMKLYASSLAGGGLNVSSKFIDRMNAETTKYEKGVSKLTMAIKKKQSSVAMSSLTEMRKAIQEYRVQGHLEGADFGIGEVNSNKRVGSGFSNNSSILYNRNKSMQEAREAREAREASDARAAKGGET